LHFFCITILAIVGLKIKQNKKVQIALNSTIPELKEKIEIVNQTGGKKNWEIYLKSLELRKNLKKEPEFIKLWNETTFPLTINTSLSGAMVYAKPYSDPDTAWYFLGKTPLINCPFPKGLSRIKIEKPNYETQYDIVLKFFNVPAEGDARQYKLFTKNDMPEEMIFVPGQKADYYKLPGLLWVFLGDYWIDRYEVTNAQYKTFLDSGGYDNSIYWDFPFIDGEDTIKFDVAKRRFIDRTGWNGPLNWEMGDFPTGEKDLPVTGISWYEAAAYAKFVKKDLPTIYHWVFISEAHAAPEITKFGNFNKKGPVKKGTYDSMTRYGTYDLPGNVSEWIFNSSENNRYIIGGNFQEPAYFYNMQLVVSPWARSEQVGFRCIQYIDETLPRI